MCSSEMSSQDVSLFPLLLECHFLWENSIAGPNVCIQTQCALFSQSSLVI